MLAHLNVAILLMWLLAELVPAIADALAASERQQRRQRRDR